MSKNNDNEKQRKEDDQAANQYADGWYTGSPRLVQECSWCGQTPVVYSEPGDFNLCESCAENAGRY